jgi:hypothetical protein
MEAAMDGALAAYGRFIGSSDGAGRLTASFAEGGGYLLITLKPGHFLGRRPIHIVDTVRNGPAAQTTEIN